MHPKSPLRQRRKQLQSTLRRPSPVDPSPEEVSQLRERFNGISVNERRR
ncbi:hypothetical protein DSBG_3042 [Desulfosporosinus sp. BG]|nr:hypothetical protein DSBG_3042 [Desulfosporosinus sp. BG]